jgi:hypothetical protein
MYMHIMPQSLMMLQEKCQQAHKQKTINHINQVTSLLEKVDSNIAIHSFINGSTALLLGPGLLFSFIIFFYTDGRTPWTRGNIAIPTTILQ